MHDWRKRSVLLAAALWWGSLTGVLGWVVPLLFAKLPSPALAGNTAAVLFAAQTWVALGCGLLVLMGLRASMGDSSWDARRLGWTLAGMLAALVLEFGITPHIVARDNLRLWHTLGTLLYALQWLCAGVLFWQLSGGPAGDADPAQEHHSRQ